MKGKRLIATGVMAACLLIGAGIALGIARGEEQPTRDRIIYIPPGAAQQVAKNPNSQIVPARIDARVGERLIIKNRDLQSHQVGPFTVLPEQTLEYPLLKAGNYKGICTLRPGKSFILAVRN